MVWRWHIPCMRPQPGGYGPWSDGWLNPAPFRQCQLASLVRSRDRYEYVWRRRETRLRGRSSAIKARSIVCLRGKRGDDGDQRALRETGYVLCTVPVPLKAHRRPEPEPHGSIASCHGAGPRDGPCNREWFLIRQRRPTGKAGRAQPALSLAPRADSRVP